MDNVFGSAENRESDFLTNISLGAGLTHQGKTDTFNLTGFLYQLFYAKNSDRNTNSQNVVLNYRHDFNARSNFTCADTFMHFPEPQTFLETFEAGGSTNAYVSNNCSLTYVSNIRRQLYFQMTYGNRYNHFLQGSQGDTMYHTPNVLLRYSITSDHLINFGYGYQYMNSEDFYNTRIHMLYLGYMYYFTKTLYAEVRGGADSITNEYGKIVTPMWYAAVQNDVTERIHVNVDFSKRYTVTVSNPELYNNWRVNGAFSLELTKRSRGAVNLFYGEGVYMNTGDSYKFIGAGCSYSYDFSERILGYVRYSYSSSSSSVDSGTVYRNIVTIGATARF